MENRKGKNLVCLDYNEMEVKKVHQAMRVKYFMLLHVETSNFCISYVSDSLERQTKTNI